MLRKCTSFLLLCIALTACQPRPCTEIGCSDGLVIDFDLEPMATAIITLRGESSDGTEESYDLRCGFQAENCPEIWTFNEFLVDKMEVEIWKDSNLVESYEQVIEYKTVTPNGPHCDPQCLQASVTVTD